MSNKQDKDLISYMCDIHKLVKTVFKDSSLPLDFEYLEGAYWYYDITDKNIFWTYEEEALKGVPLDYEFSCEVNHEIYQGEDYSMFDIDDGCGARHLKYVFSEDKKIVQLVEM